MKFWTVICVALSLFLNFGGAPLRAASAALSAPAVDSKAKATLANLATRFRKSLAVSYVSRLTVTVPTDASAKSMTSWSTTVSVSLQRPNKLRLAVFDGAKLAALVVSDGQSLSDFSPARNQYMSQITGTEFANTMRAAKYGIASLYGQDRMIDLGLAMMMSNIFVRADPDLEQVVSGVKYSLVKESIAGVSTIGVRQLITDRVGAASALIFYLNPATGLPVRFVQQIVSPEGQVIPLMRQDFSDFKVSHVPLAKGLFSWSRPASATMAALVLPDGSKPVAVGEPAPDFAIAAKDGSIVRLSDYAGKVVVLYFWATWCQACGLALSQTDKIAQDYAPDGVVFLPICSLDDNAAFQVWVGAHTKFTMPFFFDPAGKDSDHSVFSKLYGENTLPSQFVIGKDGHVFASFSGYDSVGDRKEDALIVAINRALRAS